MRTNSLRIVEVPEIPITPDPAAAYRLIPVTSAPAYYAERVDRNVGWITPAEQEIIRHATVGVAGCGGMGGLIAQVFLRLGVGEIRIADCEVFDPSNINRQFAAMRGTVGVPKAFATARLLREITDDTTIVVYPQGIAPETAESFVSGCDVVCDEIEFWAVGARLLLHRTARAQGVTVFNCNTIGFGTRLFRFAPTSATMEECLGLPFEEATGLQERIQERIATPDEVRRAMEAVIRGLIPELPDYRPGGGDRETIRARLFGEGKASIVATNPPMCTGFLCDQVLFYLLRESGVERRIVSAPEMPGYLYFDAARMQAKVVEGKWW